MFKVTQTDCDRARVHSGSVFLEPIPRKNMEGRARKDSKYRELAGVVVAE